MTTNNEWIPQWQEQPEAEKLVQVAMLGSAGEQWQGFAFYRHGTWVLQTEHHYDEYRPQVTHWREAPPLPVLPEGTIIQFRKEKQQAGWLTRLFKPATA